MKTTNNSMHAAPPAIPDECPLPLVLLKHLGIVTIFNVAGALISTYVLRASDSFLENLVFSLCIGTLALLFIDGGRMLLWGHGMPPQWPFIALLVPAIPAAKLLGDALAIQLLGLDAANVAAYQSKHAGATIWFTALACVVITWFFWRRGQFAQLQATVAAEKARAAAIEKQAMQAQLQMLQAQIEPHMLFNTLANLQGLIAVDPPRAQHMLDQLIQYLRATLSASRSDKTSLAQEFALLDAYLGLMKVRMGARLSYAFHLPEDLCEATVPPMLLQPLVENAIKHGIEPKVEGGHIDVKAERDGDLLSLTVADTGLGMDADAATSGTCVGVTNVRDRLQMLYGDRAAFSLTPNAPSGVIALLTLPL
ncbi:MAG TPA: histidine kinase [Noviherbaspirillum sp.]|uniref:sensor histidine kinase n=1 Tax=Noviherbaspirillum sp. TaxID=1926288 RepID=UPI002B45E866|nr:histidine kinase [Noviherbaspirillum sp.]HJV86294.1 histidine kinase [Noviherbaspirillum sp.]